MAREDENEGTSSTTWRRWFALGVAVVGIGVTSVGWYVLTNTETRFLHARFNRDAELATDTIQREFDRVYRLGSGINAFFANSVVVRRREAQNFAWNFALNDPHIDTLQWIVPVPSDERVLHDTRTTRARGEAYEILQPGAEGWESAEERDVHYPAYFSIAKEPDQWPTGFDWATKPRVVSGINRARESGRTSIVGPVGISSIQDDEPDPDYFLAVVPVAPSKKLAERLQTTRLLADLENRELAERQTEPSYLAIVARWSLLGVPFRDSLVPPSLDVHIVEDAQNDRARSLYSIRRERPPGPWRPEEMREEGELVAQFPLGLQHVDWSVYSISTPEYRDRHRTATPTWFLVIGLAVTAALTLLVVVTAGRAER